MKYKFYPVCKFSDLHEELMNQDIHISSYHLECLFNYDEYEDGPYVEIDMEWVKQLTGTDEATLIFYKIKSILDNLVPNQDIWLVYMD